MRIIQRLSHGLHAWQSPALIFMGIGMIATGAAAEEQWPIPTVISAQVPFYPPLPQRVNMEGTVRLKVTTDGRKVSTVKVISGVPMLVQAATENVKMWEFEEHAPAAFTTVFRYRILPTKCDSACNCESIEAPVIVLHMPTDVEISAKEMFICNPVVVKQTR